jgi:hypothetical protein
LICALKSWIASWITWVKDQTTPLVQWYDDLVVEQYYEFFESKPSYNVFNSYTILATFN